MNNVIFITLIVALVVIVVIIAILLYNQMLLLNEVNKRLLVMTKESIEKERATQEDLTEALRQLDALANEQQNTANAEQVVQDMDDNEPVFDPHAYDPNI
jgi:hypothetical protein